MPHHGSIRQLIASAGWTRKQNSVKDSASQDPGQLLLGSDPLRTGDLERLLARLCEVR
jgi:hypothetical protein